MIQIVDTKTQNSGIEKQKNKKKTMSTFLTIRERYIQWEFRK